MGAYSRTVGGLEKSRLSGGLFRAVTQQFRMVRASFADGCIQKSYLQ
ncbi:hypothetical protein [Oscillatoria sp. FACHB-1406]|nr:hypothetical protein [Oscillatoria sp. FACHB-1406]MBD2580144.1 hypothetical protein [Oscillatoria sp. FACHB-1406]